MFYGDIFPLNCTYIKKLMENHQQIEINRRQQQFLSLYKIAFPAFAKYVARMGGNLDEAKDSFQDALLAWYEKSTERSLQINKSEQAYVLGMAKYIWIKRFRSNLLHTHLDGDQSFDISIEDQVDLSETKILQVLETAGRKCMELLKSFYYDKVSPAKLARQYGFSGERSATAQKYKCLEKVRNEVKRKSLSYADFIN